jgi:dienelactone hydrolase
VIHGKIERDGYTVEKVFFQSYPGFYVTGNLYRPTGEAAAGRRPGVLCPHGHWANGRFCEQGEPVVSRDIRSGAESDPDAARYHLQARCAMLARMGCVVFFYDMVGYADSKQIEHGQGFRDAEAELRLQSAFGLQTYNSIRALDFLSSLEDVDPGRIGVTGASGGGTQTFILCAVDDRPAAAFPAVMVSTAMQGGCVCENATLLRVGTGNIELAGLMAPRPLAMTGANDWTIEIETKGLPELKALYALHGVPDLVDARCYPGFEHNYNEVSREMMYSWFNRHLRLGWAEPVSERPFRPIPAPELSVFSPEHPLPADAVDAARLRKSMAEASDRRMELLRPRDAHTLLEFRRVLGAALRAILVSDMPEPGSVAGKPLGSIDGKGFRVEKLVLRRHGTQEEVPALWVEPARWSGKVLVLVLPEGKDSLLPSVEGGEPGGALGAALAARAAVLAPDVFLKGELVPPKEGAGAPVDPKRHKDYSGYTFGYNRTVIANRAHDILTAVGYARSVPGAHTVHLAGLGEAGLWTLLARGLAGPSVGRTLATRPSFDFSEIKDRDDPRLLPGGVKYGGWGAFAALCAPGEVRILGDGDLPEVLLSAYQAGGIEPSLVRLAAATKAEDAIGDLLR